MDVFLFLHSLNFEKLIFGCSCTVQLYSVTVCRCYTTHSLSSAFECDSNAIQAGARLACSRSVQDKLSK